MAATTSRLRIRKETIAARMSPCVMGIGSCSSMRTEPARSFTISHLTATRRRIWRRRKARSSNVLAPRHWRGGGHCHDLLPGIGFHHNDFGIVGLLGSGRAAAIGDLLVEQLLQTLDHI